MTNGVGIGMHRVTAEGLAHVVHHMRERDRREIYALRWDDDPDALIADVMAHAGELWRLWSWDGVPVSVQGVVPIRPGVVVCGAFGTADWRRAIRPMTRFGREFLVPILKRSGYHSGECYAMAANTDGRRWIEHLGGAIEAVLRAYGRNREDFLLYAWDLTRERDDHVHVRRRESLVRPSNDHRGLH